MKSTSFSIITGSALVGCALNTSAAPDSVAARSLQKEPVGYTSAAVTENNYEISYSGPWLGSRDALEGGLLYRAALLAQEHGSNWFRFLHMPGEGGPTSHPSRPTPSFGAAYGHWQPHWNYRIESGWQPWHPEWGDRFWAERLAKSTVERVEVHAMIELRPGAAARFEPTDFEVSAVLRDLRPFKSTQNYRAKSGPGQ